MNNKRLPDETLRQFVRRRDLMLSSPLALSLPLIGSAQLSAQPSSGARFFNFGDTLPNEDLRKLYAGGITAGIGTQQQRHMLFWWDPDANKFLNPLRVSPKLAAAAYNLEVEVLNFHVAAKENASLANRFEDGQLLLRLKAPDARYADVDLLWVLMTGVEVFGGKKQGQDDRLQKFANLKPTDELVGPSKIEIPKGRGKFQVEFSAQRRAGIWRRILSLVKTFANSAAFGVLPIPKLVGQGIQFAEGALSFFQEQERLEPFWKGPDFRFKLYEGASSDPFTLRPGYWATIDKSFADLNSDASGNLQNTFLDLAGGFYELVNQSRKPIDANYSVLHFEFTTAKA